MGYHSFMNEIVLLIAITSIPALISTVVAYIAAQMSGKSLLRRGGVFLQVYLFSISTFLIVDFLFRYVIAWGLSTLSLGSDVLAIIFMISGPYRFFVSWGLKVLAIILLWFSLKRLPVVETADPQVVPAPKPAILGALPIFAVWALLTIVYPLYTSYKNLQLGAEWRVQMQHVADEVAATVEKNTVTIRTQLANYKNDTGMYPLTLEELVPKYLSAMPDEPRARIPEYTTNSTRSDYRFCVYLDTGKKCLINSVGAWSAVRPYCPSGERKPDIECQAGLALEATPF